MGVSEVLQIHENKWNLKIFSLKSLQWRQKSTNIRALFSSLTLERTNLQKVNWNNEGSGEVF